MALLLLAVALLAGCSRSGDGGGIDIVDVSGPLDSRALRFVADSIGRAADLGQEMVLLQFDSKAVLDGAEFDHLLALIANPPIPVATWVGPAPAEAFGGVVLLAEAGSQRAVADGARWGLIDPVVIGEDRQIEDRIGRDRILDASEWEGMALEPALFQYIIALDGKEFDTASGRVVVQTLRTPGDPLSRIPPTFIKPGFGDRFFRLAVTPEAAFFFLVAGLTVVVFEFYALGPGVAAAVGAVSLFLGGWGLSVLPTRWWAVGLILAGWLALTWAHQSGQKVIGTVLGSVLVFAGGLWMVDGAGQIDPRWWLILLSMLAVLFFYLLAMPTVQRARLSTSTIGRESLVGTRGTALVEFDPDGLVEVDGARWRATAHREAGLTEGAPVVVTGVDGLFLEVEPADREN